MALSTNMPTPRARPPREMMLSETSLINIGAKVATMEMGIQTPMMSVWARLRRKTNRTTMAMRAPKMALFLTSSMELRMKMD